MSDIRREIRERAKKPLSRREEMVLVIASDIDVWDGSRWDEIRARLLQTLLMAVLKQSKGNQCEAARRLGMHRNTFNRILGGRA